MGPENLSAWQFTTCDSDTRGDLVWHATCSPTNHAIFGGGLTVAAKDRGSRESILPAEIESYSLSQNRCGDGDQPRPFWDRLLLTADDLHRDETTYPRSTPEPPMAALLNLNDWLDRENAYKTLKPKIVTFLYHEATDDPWGSGFQRSSALPYKHSKREFVNNLDAILRAGRLVVTIEDLADLRETALLLTFDDGGKSAMYIAEELEKRAVKGHFFITTGMIGNPCFVSTRDIAELHQRGHIIGAHSHNHPRVFRNLAFGTMIDEWRTSKAVLEDITGEEVVSCSVPGGHADQNTYLSAAQSGIRQLFDSEPTFYLREQPNLQILGRICPRPGTSLETVSGFVHLKGFHKARAIRFMKKAIKKAMYHRLFRKAEI